MMKKHFLILIALYLVLVLNVNGQSPKRIAKEIQHFQLPDSTSNIDFLVFSDGLSEKKPVFLFCQGSMPIPLIVKSTNEDTLVIAGGVSNFDLSEIKRYYHLVVVSMPETPLIADQSHLNESWAFITDSNDCHSFRVEFMERDYLDNYVNRANRVLEFLKSQPWVSKKRVVVAGHSQGTHIASKLVSVNSLVTHLGLFAANPFGRINQMIRSERKKAEKGECSWEQAEGNIAYWMVFWKDANDPELLKNSPNLRTWKSFSEPTYPYLLQSDVPIYMVYGTEDDNSDLCDLLPLLFINQGKNNLTIERKIGLEHNFFEVDNNGNVNYDKPHWHHVMNDFIEWTLR